MVRTLAVLKESKTDAKGREVENRVILTPPLLAQIKARFPGLQLYVESNAGAKIDLPDQDYEQAGAWLSTHTKALEQDLIVGVKETRREDFDQLRDNIFSPTSISPAAGRGPKRRWRPGRPISRWKRWN